MTLPAVRTLVTAGATDPILAGFDEPAALLTPVERNRAAAFRRAGDRDDFVAAHLLVRLCAAQVLDTEPAGLTLVQHCATCGGPHGQPSLREAPELAVSLAHTRGWVAAAAGRGRVGVDLELLRTDALDEGLVRMALTRGETAVVHSAETPWLPFLRYWVAKESLVKVGAITLDDLHDVDLSMALTGDQADWDGLRIGLWHQGATIIGCASTEPAEYRPANALSPPAGGTP